MSEVPLDMSAHTSDKTAMSIVHTYLGHTRASLQTGTPQKVWVRKFWFTIPEAASSL